MYRSEEEGTLILFTLFEVGIVDDDDVDNAEDIVSGSMRVSRVFGVIGQLYLYFGGRALVEGALIDSQERDRLKSSLVSMRALTHHSFA